MLGRGGAVAESFARCCGTGGAVGERCARCSGGGGAFAERWARGCAARGAGREYGGHYSGAGGAGSPCAAIRLTGEDDGAACASGGKTTAHSDALPQRGDGDADRCCRRGNLADGDALDEHHLALYAEGDGVRAAVDKRHVRLRRHEVGEGVAVFQHEGRGDGGVLLRGQDLFVLSPAVGADALFVEESSAAAALVAGLWVSEILP